jgi:hypothetical protein
MDWRLMALAAISEGYCPEHKTPLDPQPQGGWCGACGLHAQGAWYSIRDGDTVVTSYPLLAS